MAPQTTRSKGSLKYYTFQGYKFTNKIMNVFYINNLVNINDKVALLKQDKIYFLI
tara:strand:+ start:4092 stop:4256 length:165 start_codon:yes stop_codon:yes gene_type:complete